MVWQLEQTDENSDFFFNFLFFGQVYYNLPLHFGSPFPPSEKVTWLKWHVIPYGKLGPELSSCKTQLTRKPLLSTCELSVQAQDPTSCSHPHVTPGCNLLWKQVSDYQQEKVIPDNMRFISPGKTLEYKVKSIDKLCWRRRHCTAHRQTWDYQTQLHGASQQPKDSLCRLKTHLCTQLLTAAQPRALNTAAFTGCCAWADTLLLLWHSALPC